MGYFRYTKSEEDLKSQYRQLLIRYDYKSGKNKRVIDAITKEYEQMVKQARYDNGYRTFGQKIKEEFTEAINENKRVQEQEASRKRALANKPYTQQDLQRLMLEQKNYLRKMIPIAIKEDYDYKTLKAIIISADREKEIYDSCMNIITSMGNYESQEIFDMKEKMEYCVFSLAGKDEDKSELLLKKVEDQLGVYAQQVFEQCEPAVDPIKELEIKRMVREKIWAKKERSISLKILEIMLSIPGFLIIFFPLAIMAEDKEFELSIILVATGIGLFWIWITHLAMKGTKLRVEDRKRIRGRERDEEDYKNRSIVRAILRLFGVGW